MEMYDGDIDRSPHPRQNLAAPVSPDFPSKCEPFFPNRYPAILLFPRRRKMPRPSRNLPRQPKSIVDSDVTPKPRETADCAADEPPFLRSTPPLDTRDETGRNVLPFVLPFRSPDLSTSAMTPSGSPAPGSPSRGWKPQNLGLEKIRKEALVCAYVGDRNAVAG